MTAQISIDNEFAVAGADAIVLMTLQDEEPKDITPLTVNWKMVDKEGEEIKIDQSATPAIPTVIEIDGTDLALQTEEEVIQKRVNDIRLNAVERFIIINGTFPSAYGGSSKYVEKIGFWMVVP